MLYECSIPMRDVPFMLVLGRFLCRAVVSLVATLCGPAACGGLELTLVLPGVPALDDSLRVKSEG